MIGTVHLGMAIQALAVDDEDGVRPRRHGLVTPLDVARLAQHGCPHGEQLGLVRAMRGVAGEAILFGRRVLPEKRPAFVGVAAIALVVDRVGGNQFLSLRPVDVVAARALDAPPQVLVAEQVRRALQLRLADALMTREAHLPLCARLQQRLLTLRVVHRVAGDAAFSGQVVLAAAPEHLVLLRLVALQAGFARFYRRELGGIRYFRGIRALDVRGAVAVASLAVPNEALRLKLHRLAVDGHRERLADVLMTSQTGVFLRRDYGRSGRRHGDEQQNPKSD